MLILVSCYFLFNKLNRAAQAVEEERAGVRPQENQQEIGGGRVRGLLLPDARSHHQDGRLPRQEIRAVRRQFQVHG